MKLSLLRLTNTGDYARAGSRVTAYVEWTLGVLREHTQHQVQTEFERRAAARSSRATASIPQFAELGRVLRPERAGDGVHRRPPRVPRPQRLARRSGRPAARRLVGRDRRRASIRAPRSSACSTSRPARRRDVAVLLGAAESREAARGAGRPVSASAKAAREALEAQRRRVGASGCRSITVRTPEPSLRRDDQPLDAVPGALLPDVGPLGALPEQRRLRLPRPAAGRDGVRLRRAGVAREHILRAAAPPVRRGRRAALVAPAERPRRAHPLLRRPGLAPVRGRPLRARHRRRRGARRVRARSSRCARSSRTSTRCTTCPSVAERARHACTSTACARCGGPAPTGAHGLPLIGIGDWNDGMNRVGVEGRGESVWLAWFLIATLRAFAEHARRARRRRRWRRSCGAQADALRRGGRGARLGRRVVSPRVLRRRHAARLGARATSAASTRSRRAGASSPAPAIPTRQAQAMRSLERASGARGRAADHAAHAAVRPDRRTIPATSRATCPACARTARSTRTPRSGPCSPRRCMGDGDRAFELFQMLNPLDARAHAGGAWRSTRSSRTSSPPTCTPRKGQLGRGGWTWYTGSASWMYRVGAGGDPRLHQAGRHASEWIRACRRRGRSSRIEYRYGGAVYEVAVERPSEARAGAQRVTLDGRVLEGEWIDLVDDGARHRVVVTPLFHLSRTAPEAEFQAEESGLSHSRPRLLRCLSRSSADDPERDAQRASPSSILTSRFGLSQPFTWQLLGRSFR